MRRLRSFLTQSHVSVLGIGKVIAATRFWLRWVFTAAYLSFPLAAASRAAVHRGLRPFHQWRVSCRRAAPTRTRWAVPAARAQLLCAGLGDLPGPGRDPAPCLGRRSTLDHQEVSERSFRVNFLWQKATPEASSDPRFPPPFHSKN